jgi:hypothetical protein
MTPDEATRQALADALDALFVKDGIAFGYRDEAGVVGVMHNPWKVADAILATEPGSRLTVSESQKLSDSTDHPDVRAGMLREARRMHEEDGHPAIVMRHQASGSWEACDTPVCRWTRRLIAAALPAAQEPESHSHWRHDGDGFREVDCDHSVSHGSEGEQP